MKRLACIFRRHRWTIHEENGEMYDVCSRCGKLLRYRPSGAEDFGKTFAELGYIGRGEGGGNAPPAT
jgi:hypothetical protein